jgi:hypothetical protein
MSQSFMPEHAPFVVLAFLGTAALVGALLLAAVFSAALRRWKLARWAGAGAVLVAAGYGTALLVVSLASREKVLKPGDRKYFCEIDCHLAYSVDRVELAPTDDGTRYVVWVKAWFDPNTIAPFRGDSPLGPNPRVAFLLDPAGRRYSARPESLAPLARPLRPGESVTAPLSFDVPIGVEARKLLLGDPPGLESALIGHENSPLHARIFFALGPPAAANAAASPRP